MNPISVSIDEFPDDGAPWRIDGLGRLHSTGSSRTEPLIERSHLGYWCLTTKTRLKNGSLGTRTKRVPVKVGFMVLLKPGSVWKNKEQCLPKLSQKTMCVFRLSWTASSAPWTQRSAPCAGSSSWPAKPSLRTSWGGGLGFRNRPRAVGHE